MSDELNTINNIAESEYVFQEEYLKLASKFLPVEDISMLKAGMFGYTTSVLAHVARDGVFHRNMLYDEFFLTRARLNSTLYTWAKTLNKEISLASPARMDVAFKMSVKELQDIAAPQANGNYMYNLSRDTVFDVAGVKFLLPYSVRILLYANRTGSMNITASYLFDDYNYKDPSISTPYLKLFTTNENGVDYVTIAMTIFQLEKHDWIFSVTSNDILDAGLIEQKIGNNLVSFRAQYQESTYYRDIEMIFNELDTPSSKTFGYYTLVGDDTIRLYFSTKTNEFRPIFNSKIKLEVFTTSGEAGNFAYGGSISVRENNLNKSAYSILPLVSKSTGGASAAAFLDNKKALINALRSRDNIITEYDLNNYFETEKKKRLSANSNMITHKVRDDFFRRQYSLFLLNRTNDGHVIPTNTVDLSFSIDDIEDMGYSIKPGTFVIYDRLESRYRILNDDELPEAYLGQVDNYVFCVPFLINFDFKEFPKANYYLTNYSTSIPLTYSYFNIDSPYEVILNSYNIKREPLYADDFFKVSCTLNTTQTRLEDFKVRAVLRNAKGDAIGYFDLEREENTSSFSKKLHTSDRFNSDGFYIIENSIYDITSETLISEFLLDGQYTINIAVLMQDDALSTEKQGVLSTLSDLNDYALIIDTISNDRIAFADDLGGMMYSQISIDNINGKVNLRRVPIISTLFYLNTNYNTQIMNEIYDTLLMSREISRKLENKTSIDLKFYNSCGISHYFDIDTTDIRLKMSIALNSYSPTKELENKIKRFIVKFIEECNTNIDRRFSFSNLIRAMENNFSEIKYIKFFSVNGANIQNIEVLPNVDTTDTFYIPEFITVRKTLPNSAAESDFDYDIDITFI